MPHLPSPAIRLSVSEGVVQSGAAASSASQDVEAVLINFRRIQEGIAIIGLSDSAALR
jgi:hypothetical protein